MSDLDFKDKGNKFFTQRKYDEAIKCYTDAINLKPGVCIYYTNRALCNLRCRRWDKVCQDCRLALEIDPVHVKAHFFLGQALLESQAYDESVLHFQRAYDLAKEQKVNYGDDISALIRLARKKRFTLEEEARVAQEIELQSYINRLILRDRKHQIAAAKSRKDSLNESSKGTSHKPLSHANPSDDKENIIPSEDAEEVEKVSEHSNSLPESPNTSNRPEHDRDMDDIWDNMTEEQILSKTDDYLHEVNNMFAKLDERRRTRDVPDYLCGKISFDILKEPVVTPSGITYDRKDIVEHLQRVGHFDPITRTKLNVDMLVPNLAMKEVVDHFLQENEWAVEY